MEETLFQLRSFVHQRLFAAAEEILGEVEKTITLAVSQAEVGGFQEGESLQQLRDHLQQSKDAEIQVAGCSAELKDENQSCSEINESSFIMTPNIPGPSDQDENNWNFSLAETDFKIHHIKEEQGEFGDDSQTLAVVFPTVVKLEQLRQLSKMSPASPECSAILSENDYSNIEEQHSLGEDNTLETGTFLQEQRGNGSPNNLAALPYDMDYATEQKDQSYCHLCGKGFQYIGSLMKHIKTHESESDCGFCGKAHQSTKQLISHLKSCHTKSVFCKICGKAFSNSRCLQLHERTHAGSKDFMCPECNKTFQRKDHLVVHLRTHSGEKPYRCDLCGKAFSQSQNLTIHKRSHSGEKPHRCLVCGKPFNTSSHLKTHMRYHSGEKPYSCDICGKSFSQSGQVTRHKITHRRETAH